MSAKSSGDCILLKSNRGGDLLYSDGYTYHLNKKVSEKYFWRCANYHASRCGVTFTTIYLDGKHSVIAQSHDHLHSPDSDKRIALELRRKIKETAVTSMETPVQIIQQCSQYIPSSRTPHVPSDNALRCLIKRTRNKDIPSLPRTINDIVIPDEFCKVDSEQFLIAHYTYDGECVIIFSTMENIKLLVTSPYWLMDGTFKTCPLPFCQIYSVHGLVGSGQSTSKVVPLIFALLSSKTKKCYNAFIELLKRFAMNHLSVELNPSIIYHN